LAGRPGLRIRVGDYRMLYEIDDVAREIHIFRIAHRKEAYR
jgi:mRNA interferase RelE/StbE